MKNNLTKKEIDFIQRIEKIEKNSHYNYIAVGLLGCLVILGIVLGIKFRSKDGLMLAIYFATLGAMILLKTKTDSRMIKIIKKLQSQMEK